MPPRPARAWSARARRRTARARAAPRGTSARPPPARGATSPAVRGQSNTDDSRKTTLPHTCVTRMCHPHRVTSPRTPHSHSRARRPRDSTAPPVPRERARATPRAHMVQAHRSRPTAHKRRTRSRAIARAPLAARSRTTRADTHALHARRRVRPNSSRRGGSRTRAHGATRFDHHAHTGSTRHTDRGSVRHACRTRSNTRGGRVWRVTRQCAVTQ